MRKGLKLTLMTVAIALISVQAMAVAPTISDIPSPVVGSAEPVTGGSKFLFIDSPLDTDILANDDTTAAKNLMWTYTGPGGSGSASHYLINGVNAIDVGSANVTSPTLAQIINKNDKDPVTGQDGKANTLTIRNKFLSPVTGGNTTVSTTGVIAAETQLVTFFVSDGDKYSSKTVFFYSDNGGPDRLSGQVFKLIKTDAPAASAWTNLSDWTAAPNAPTRTNPTGGGVCMGSSLTGNVMGSVISPMPYFTLTANTVYRIKATMNSSQATKGAVPLWDIILDNSDPRTGTGLNLYALDYQMFDDPYNGGANTVTSAGSVITIMWAPPAVSVAQWNTNAFTTALATQIQPMVHFRIMDFDSVGYGSTKSGSVCITQLTVESVPVTRAVVSKNVVNLTALAAAGTTGGNVECASAISAQHITATFTSGVLTVTPTTTSVANTYDSNGDGTPDQATTGQQFESTEVHPMTSTTSTDPYAADKWPITWESFKTFRLQASLAAPASGDQAKPWDAYWFGFVTPTYEIASDSYCTSNQALASPVTGTPQIYTMFFYSGKETTATNAAFHKIKWYIRFLNHPAVYFPSGNPSTDPLNTGAVALSKVVIDQVDFK